MSIHTVDPCGFDFSDPKQPIRFQFSSAPLSSDAGLILFRQFDERIQLTEAFAKALDDPRDPKRIDHSFLEMTRMRVYAILAGYEDQNDHDTLRTDPVFKLIAKRSPDGPNLASQPTLSRFENQINITSLKRLRDVFIDQFIQSFVSPPISLMFDLDAVDDETHGSQQLCLFHGYYEQYQYLPLLITSAETDQIVLLSLRHGTASASLGANDDLEYLVNRIRTVWPDVIIRVRGDGGFGNPTMHECCDRLKILYTFGQASNRRLQENSQDLLDEAQRLWNETHQPQRLFDGFWYQAESWACRRWVIVKAEVNSHGANRRFIVTNRTWSQLYAEATYDEYVMRGESENRNKEFKCDLAMDRMSDHRFMANYFRLYLHALAMNLLVRLRHEIAEPLLADELSSPSSSRSEQERKQYQNRRRRHDPLGEGQPSTWRMLIIKVAATVIVSSRRIVIQLSRSWPHWQFFQRLSEHLATHR